MRGFWFSCEFLDNRVLGARGFYFISLKQDINHNLLWRFAFRITLIRQIRISFFIFAHNCFTVKIGLSCMHCVRADMFEPHHDFDHL